jgi:hypothetical protein
MLLLVSVRLARWVAAVGDPGGRSAPAAQANVKAALQAAKLEQGVEEVLAPRSAKSQLTLPPESGLRLTLRLSISCFVSVN